MNLTLREAHSDELVILGDLMVAVYATLPDFPTPTEQPGYYAMLRNLSAFAKNPDAKVLVALADEHLVGGVVYFSSMSGYGSGGSAPREKNAAAFRLLAVDARARGLGVGRALVDRCIAIAREEKQRSVIIHTTRAMQVAWAMYETLGFVRDTDLDFVQGTLDVFGFRLRF